MNFRLRIKQCYFCMVIGVMSTQLQGMEQSNTELMTLEDVTSGNLLFKTLNSHQYRQAFLVKTEMTLDVKGLIAIVKVKQHFRNTSDDWLEGVYAFPLPENAAVNEMRIQIGERIIEGEIKEKYEARKLYQAAKANGQAVSLVEQRRPNLFTNSIANIAPSENIIVEIQYLQKVEYQQGKFNLTFPTTITPRYSPGKIIQQSGWLNNSLNIPSQALVKPMKALEQSHQLTITALIDLSMPLENISSSSHSIASNQTTKKHQYKIELLKSETKMNRDFVLEWSPVTGQQPQAALFSEPKMNAYGENESYLMLMLIPPQLLAEEDRLPREMIFVIDTSGSMAGNSMRQAQASLSFALTRLTLNDRFNIIEFNTTSHKLFNSSQVADQYRKGQAQHYIASLEADGGTEMAPALITALDDETPVGYLRQVVFITDGAVDNESELFSIIHQKLNQARLFTVGIGSAPNSYFMRKSAQFGRGTFSYIRSIDEVQTKMSQLFRKLESPVITNLKITWPDDTDVYPRRLADLYLDEPLVISAKLKEQNGRVTIEGQTRNGQWVRTLQLNIGKSDEGVSTLWARSKIEDLMDQLIEGSDEDRIKPQVLSVALQHKLMSQYTSFIAIDKTPSRVKEQLLKEKMIANMKPKSQNFQFPDTATTAQRNILFGLLLMLTLLILNFIGNSRIRSSAQT